MTNNEEISCDVMFVYLHEKVIKFLGRAYIYNYNT